MRVIAVIGAAFSAGGADEGCRHGPKDFYDYAWPDVKRNATRPIRWAETLRQLHHFEEHYPNIPTVRESNHRLAKLTRRLAQGGEIPLVIGGDHSCAIGTWSGIAKAKNAPIGLLWIDAHLDSHTPETSESHRVHGMPLATLLGEGDPLLSQLSGRNQAVNPNYCVVIGARSYEAPEPLRLARLGVRVYTIEEIKLRGLTAVFNEAWRKVAASPTGFGVSLDLDVLDPDYAKGVSVPEDNGLSAKALIHQLKMQPFKERLIGLEIVELNPLKDFRGETRKTLSQLIRALLYRRF